MIAEMLFFLWRLLVVRTWWLQDSLGFDDDDDFFFPFVFCKGQVTKAEIEH